MRLLLAGVALVLRNVWVWLHYAVLSTARRGSRRYNPERPDSILEHSLADEKLTRLYRDDDWATLAADEAGFLAVRSVRVPYVVFANEDDVTTGKPDQLAARLELVLGRLWELQQAR